MLSMVVCPDCGGEGGWPSQVDITMDGTPIVLKERCERCEGKGEIECLENGPRHYLGRCDKCSIIEELQNIVWLIDEGPPHPKLTEAIDRIHALKKRIYIESQ